MNSRIVKLQDDVRENLIRAIKTNNFNDLKRWIATLIPQPQDTDIDLGELLVAAAKYNRPYMIRLLLEKKANFFLYSDTQQNSYHRAALSCIDIVKTSWDVGEETDAGKLLNKEANDLIICNKNNLVEYYSAARDRNFIQLEKLIKNKK